jgi:hypothetical protein
LALSLCVYGHVRRPSRNVTPIDAHGNADVGLCQCWGIIHVSARHGHSFAPLLALFHNQQLLFRRCPGKNNVAKGQQAVPFLRTHLGKGFAKDNRPINLQKNKKELIEERLRD